MVAIIVVDVTLFLVSKGKARKTMFQTWSVFSEATQNLLKFSCQPEMMNSDDFNVLEKFYCLSL